jgi:hypothetical protein
MCKCTHLDECACSFDDLAQRARKTYPGALITVGSTGVQLVARRNLAVMRAHASTMPILVEAIETSERRRAGVVA